MRERAERIWREQSEVFRDMGRATDGIEVGGIS